MQDTVSDGLVEPAGVDSVDAPDAIPGHFWAVAAVGFLWNCVGVYFYMMAKLQPGATLEGMPPAMREYALDMPLWAHIGWSLGIWGSFVGSVLLLLRHRLAATAFLVSLLGAIASFTAQGLAGVLTPAEPIMVLAIIMFLLWYSRTMRAAGVLR